MALDAPERLPGEQHNVVARHGNGGLTALFHSQTFASLLIRDYRWLWLSSMAGFMAMQMQMVARGYLIIYELEGSAMDLVWVMVSMALPMSVFSLIGGAITDRVSKRNLLGSTMVASAVITLTIAVFIHLGQIEFWHLILAGVFNGIVLSFQMPGRYSFIPQVVGEERLVNATGLNTAGMNLSRILSPAVAGVLIATIGTASVFYIMGGLYALGAVAVFVMHHRGDPEGHSHQGVAFDIKEGLRYVRGNNLVMALLVMAFIGPMFGFPYMLLMPEFAKEVLDLGAEGLGLLMAITGIGAIVGSLVVAYLGNYKHLGLLLFGGALLWGVALAGFSQATSLALAVVPLVLVGLASAVFMAINLSLIQMYAAPEMRGRVMSIFMLTFAFMPLGLLPVGAAAQALGTPIAFLGSSILLVLSTVLVFLLIPAVRRLRPLYEDGVMVSAVGHAGWGRARHWRG